MKKIALFFILLASAGLCEAKSLNLLGTDSNQTDSNHKKQGIWKETTFDITAYGTYEDDKKEGVWASYYASGIMSTLDSYHRGLKNGLSIAIDRSGNYLGDNHYSDGELDGRSRSYSLGRLKTEIYYKNGKLNGSRKIFSTDGKLEEEGYYQNDLKEGVFKWYYSNGKPITESVYKNGNLDGPQITYYKSGSRESECLYRNNKREGLYKEFFDDGKIKTEGQFANDLEEGNWKTVNETGKSHIRKYKKGTEISK